MALDPNCIFCKIINGEIPAEIVYRDENVLAFNDLNPQAPTHVLLIPTLHVENAAAMADASAVISAALLKVASRDCDRTRHFRAIEPCLTLAQRPANQYFTLICTCSAGAISSGHLVREG
jgi:hypothetical protein